MFTTFLFAGRTTLEQARGLRGAAKLEQRMEDAPMSELTAKMKIYKKQIVKQQLSSRVVDAEMPDNQYTLEETEELLAFDNDGYAHDDKLSLQGKENSSTTAAASSDVINLVNDDMEGTEGVLESDGSDEEGDEDTEGVDIVQDQEIYQYISLEILQEPVHVVP